MKKLERYEIEEKIRTNAEKERLVSNQSYASKIYERILLWLITATAFGVLGFIGRMLVKLIEKQ